jgi:hypothetical protein
MNYLNLNIFDCPEKECIFDFYMLDAFKMAQTHLRKTYWWPSLFKSVLCMAFEGIVYCSTVQHNM